METSRSKEKEQAVSDALALVKSRDLRFYGAEGFDLRDSLKLAAQIRETPASDNEGLEVAYSLAIPEMDAFALADCTRKLRKCPPRPRKA